MSPKPSPTPSTTQPSLRERNYAHTRLGILEACLALTATRSFGELSVREIAEQAGVSQGTFFNHFGTKDDVLFFFMRLWTVRVGERASGALERGTARDAIGALFELLADEMADHPRMMLEVISVIANASERPRVELTPAERLIALGALTAPPPAQETRLDDLLSALLRAAVKRGELPRSARATVGAQTLQAVFYGVPIALRGEPVSSLRRAYREALALVWQGLRAR